MTKQKISALMKRVNDLSDDELVEIQKLITHLLGARRSLQILAGNLERPGRRGKRWKVPKAED